MAQEQLINDLKKEIEQLKNEGRVLEALPLMKQAANWGDLENQKELVDLYFFVEAGAIIDIFKNIIQQLGINFLRIGILAA